MIRYPITLMFALIGVFYFLMPVCGHAQSFVSEMDDVSGCDDYSADLTFSAIFDQGSSVNTTSITWQVNGLVTLAVDISNGVFTDNATDPNGASYSLEVQQFGDLFVIDGTITGSTYPGTGSFSDYDNIPVSFAAVLDGSPFVRIDQALLFVHAEPTNATGVTSISICEGEDISIDIDETGGTADAYEWRLDGTPVTVNTATLPDLTIPSAAEADGGTYRLFYIDNNGTCGEIDGPSIAVDVTSNATIDGTDLTAKELTPGNTVTFNAPVSNIDNLSTYTWQVAGTDVTESSTFPVMIVVDANTTLQVNSVVNTATSTTETTSVITIENLSSSTGSYDEMVQLTVTNNSVCSASMATVVSNTASVFPVEWLSFQLKAAEKDEINLYWATASETNNEVFLIERANDGKNFQVVGEVSGYGTTTVRQDYSFVDDKLPVAGQLTYRIKQVDFDGQFSYSDMRTLRLEQTADKPVVRRLNQQGDLLDVSLYTPVAGPATIVVYDLRGVAVFQENLGTVEGIVESPISLPSIASGVYILQFRQGDILLNEKITWTR